MLTMLCVTVVNYFLPSYKQCNLDFLALIVSEKKAVLTVDSIKRRNVPLWPELGLCHVWEKFAADPNFLKYLPNVRKTPSLEIERRFFWGVACTL